MSEAAEANTAASVNVMLLLEEVKPSKTNPRREIKGAALDELTASVRRLGVLQPVLVRPNGKGYELVAGHRRFEASKAAGLTHVPAVVRKLTDLEALEIQVIENLDRQDLHPLEEAQGYHQLMRVQGKWDVAKLAERVGRSEKYIYDRIKLLQLTKAAQQEFFDGRITAGHAIILARLSAKDQERCMDVDSGGLWTYQRDLGFTPEQERSEEERERHKPVSVRELQAWIDTHVRLEPAPDPMLFPETVQVLTSAKEVAEKVISIMHDYHVHPDAKDAEGKRTYGPMSWRRADGQYKTKTCEASVTGVIVVGPGRGEAFKVCADKKGCKVHWADVQRKAARSQSAGGQTTRQMDSYQKQQEKQRAENARREAECARWKKATPAILDAVAAAVNKAPTKAGGLLADTVLARLKGYGQKIDGRVPRGKTAEDLLRCAAFLVLSGQAENAWTAVRDFPKVARGFGIDVRKILDQVAPAPPAEKPAAAAKGKKKGKK